MKKKHRKRGNISDREFMVGRIEIKRTCGWNVGIGNQWEEADWKP